MSKKIPPVKIPKNVIISASLGSRNGKIDRNYLRNMAKAIYECQNHKNANLKKTNRETSDA